jgi:alkanesulfonate monooxygenase SsuD/methylene tetrahydromethanopterin reductase-like flavin-dependent oxidoreductase (luciferase family)
VTASGSPGFDLCRFQLVPWATLLEEVLYLQRLGARAIWLADHYAWPPAPERQLLEPWTALAALAARTERIRLGTTTDVALRHPAVLAKQTATVDGISGGRVELALAAGGFEEELSWLGIPYLTPAGRASRLREATEIVDGLLREGRLSYRGEHYRLDDAPLVPELVQTPRPPLLVAANGRKGLRLAAELADGSLSVGDRGATSEDAAAALRERNAVLDQYCAELGRDPASLERWYLVGWAAERPFASPDALVDFLGRYREAGARRFIFLFGSKHADGAVATRDALESFAVATLTD